EGTGKREAGYVVLAIVETVAVPVGMKAFPWVGVLVEVCAVEVAEPVFVGRKMGGHPVEDHADAALVQEIDEVHEVLWRAVAAARHEVAGGLVAPRAEERVLHDGQELDVGEAQTLQMI